jgi:predicted dehydrogenase
VTIVTPNDAHFGPADAAAAAGIGVLCEKPLTTTLDEARRLHQTVARNRTPFVVAYTYTGFPMVMLAKQMLHDGKIGEVLKVEAWYPQGWLASKIEDQGQKQALWRVDPKKSGVSGCGGDIGTHAYEFVRFVAGRWTTTSPCWPSWTTAASPPSPPRRSPSAPRTTSASASAARPARWSGQSRTTPC